MVGVDVTSREQAIVALLERYDDLVDPQQIRAGGSRDSFGALMPATYNDSVRELERLLCSMRDSRGAIVKWTVKEQRYAASPRKLWWHLNARFITSQTVQRKTVVRRKTKRGKTVTDSVWRMVRLPNGSVDVMVDRGVVELAQAWALPHEPMLPRPEVDLQPVAA